MLPVVRILLQCHYRQCYVVIKYLKYSEGAINASESVCAQPLLNKYLYIWCKKINNKGYFKTYVVCLMLDFQIDTARQSTNHMGQIMHVNVTVVYVGKQHEMMYVCI